MPRSWQVRSATQWTAGDRLQVFIGLCQVREDIPPVVDEVLQASPIFVRSMHPVKKVQYLLPTATRRSARSAALLDMQMRIALTSGFLAESLSRSSRMKRSRFGCRPATVSGKPGWTAFGPCLLRRSFNQALRQRLLFSAL